MGVRQFERVALAVVVCLAVAFGPTSGAMASQTTAQTPGVTPDTVVMRAEVHENGSATWEVAYRTRLDDADTAAAFEGLKADIENDSRGQSGRFARRMTNTIDAAESATGREMNGTNFTVDAEIREFPQRYGVVTYSFRWQNFAAVDGDRVRVGDALTGLYLNEKTRLLVSWPEGYEADAVRPEPDERRETAAVWSGPTQFASNEPRVVLAAPSASPFGLPAWAVAAIGGAAAALLFGAVGTWWLYRRPDREERSEDPDEELPEELLSNEERVIRLLERRGGRVKQRAVVEEFDWTEAKTSQVVGRLREQGKVESFRLGRENVLALAKEEHNA